MRGLVSAGSLAWVIAIAWAPAAVSGVTYVNASATGANDGSTWSDAHRDLRSALASDATEVWVAAGTYTPAGPGGSQLASFALKSGQSLYGGFSGSETDRSQRDPSANPTILSGDIDGDDGGLWTNFSNNARHVLRAENVDASTVLDGFVIEHGYTWAASGSESAGAGLFADGSSLMVRNCTFRENLAHSGAAIYANESSLTIEDTVFQSNLAEDGRGGAIYHGAYPNLGGQVFTLTLAGCEFSGNSATVGASAGAAGAIWSDFDAPLAIDRCRFIGNEARWRFSSGSYSADGGAMLVFGSGSRIANSLFLGNRAHIGGALWIGRDTEVANCLFTGNEAYRQSAGFYDYGGYGGAVYSPGYGATAVAIANSTFHANTARSVGAVLGGGNTILANCILWSNTSTETEATLLDQQIGGDPVLDHSLVKGLHDKEPAAAGDSNPDQDPVFVDADGADDIAGNLDDDLRLSAGSPAIDAGNVSALPAWAAGLTDFGGITRRLDDPATPDAAGQPPPVIDLGCHEYDPGIAPGTNAPPVADFDFVDQGNGTIAFTDQSTDSDGNIAERIWYFGDGRGSASRSSNANPSHAYSANGTFSATLVVRDNLGSTSTASRQTVTISGLTPPTVAITAPAGGTVLAGMVPLEAMTDTSIIRVKFYLDGVLIDKDETPTATADGRHAFSITLDTSAHDNTAHTLTAKGNDLAETEFTSDPVAVTIDNLTPRFTTAPFDADANAGTLFSLATVAAGDPTPTYVLSTGPEGASVDPTTGFLIWNPPASALHQIVAITIRATNSWGADELSGTVTVVDSSAPATPAGLVASGATPTGIRLVWNASTDNVGVAGYRIYEDVYINQFNPHNYYLRADVQGTDTTALIGGLAPGTSHKYAIAAYDAEGNQSPRSATIATATAATTAFHSWAAGYFSAAELADPALEATLWGMGADPDSDRGNNLAEFALRGNPTAPGDDPMRESIRMGEITPDGHALVLVLLPTAAPAGCEYVLEASFDLGVADPWTAIATKASGAAWAGDAVVLNSSASGANTLYTIQSPSPDKFFRLSIRFIP